MGLGEWNIPSRPSTLPGERFLRWCVRTYSRRLGALEDTPRTEALKRPEHREPVCGKTGGMEGRVEEGGGILDLFTHHAVINKSLSLDCC